MSGPVIPMNLLPVLAALLVFLPGAGAHASPPVWQEWPVPLALEARPAPVSVPEGWQASAKAAPCRLLTVTVYDGLPQEQASLVPESDQALPGGRGVLSWTLAPVSAAGTWVALGYSCKTLVLSRPLPPGATGLRVSYDLRSRVEGLPRIVRVEVRVAAEPPAGGVR
jgi:hypothetical protein